MVAKGFPMPRINKDGTPRKKPGKPAHPADVKTDRLVLRVHPDLLEVLTKRSEERGITRSQYVEKLLIGWSNIDPRNRRLELVGKVSPTAPSPWEIRRKRPLEFADRWQKFCAASLLLLGAEPPREWFEDEWEGEFGEQDPDSGKYPAEDLGDMEGPIPRSFQKKQRKRDGSE